MQLWFCFNFSETSKNILKEMPEQPQQSQQFSKIFFRPSSANKRAVCEFEGGSTQLGHIATLKAGNCGLV